MNHDDPRDAHLSIETRLALGVLGCDVELGMKVLPAMMRAWIAAKTAAETAAQAAAEN